MPPPTGAPDSVRPADGPASLWRPLRTPTFRNLFLADVISDMGTFMQSVASAWLMVSFGAGPMFVALTQTASTLPFFVLALPAGSLGDIVDRRKLILYTEAWMVGVAILLLVATIGGFMSPWLLLGLTFARWKRPVHKRSTPPEIVTGATVAAIRYVRYSPTLRRVMLRAGMTMFAASALLAL